MSNKECAGCKFQCFCCIYRSSGTACSGCEGKNKDEFKLDSEFVLFCPQSGSKSNIKSLYN